MKNAQNTAKTAAVTNCAAVKIDTKIATISAASHAKNKAKSVNIIRGGGCSKYGRARYALIPFIATFCLSSAQALPNDLPESSAPNTQNTSSTQSMQDTQDTESQKLEPQKADSRKVDSSDTESKTLSKITAIGAKEKEDKYNSTAGTISRDMIESNPSGNGDITSLLRMLPNVQYDNAQLRSTTPGEIDPANISISGGLFYQNNFQLDGFNMNNDLDPNGGTTNNQSNIRGGRSQGLNVDTSLLDSIRVQDSNVSAAYGGFTGGVVEANVRKPRTDGWHANISYKYTSDKLTQYHIHQSAEALFATSADENYQPHFTKHLVKANLQGYITQNLGITAAFSTTQSFIPLQNYRSNYSSYGNDVTQKRDQKRQSYNYYLKAHYNPTENLMIEANISYMPQYNTYFNSTARDSYYAMESGGVQSGLKAVWDNALGAWTNSLSYSFLENSRRSDKNYFYQWRRSADKNWGGLNNLIFEGGYGNIDQKQNTLNYKSDFLFTPLQAWITTHIFRAGVEVGYQQIARNRLNDLYTNMGNPVNTNGVLCGTDSLGLDLCSNIAPDSQPTWSGQYANRLRVWEKGNIGFDSVSYGAFLEDDIRLNLKKFGDINARIGLRFDGDNYMSKQTLAPRFSLNYITPWNNNYKTNLIFGANRYYGRNLFSYRLYAEEANYRKNYTRTSPDFPWVESTSDITDKNYSFSKLNVPYDDELMAGITQNLWYFTTTLKYIHREGNDEIMRQEQAGITHWTNNGNSQSNIVSLMIQNYQPLELLSVKNHFLFAFDWTQTRRSYNLFGTDEAYVEDRDILYDGALIKYRNRPTENFARPYTLRLTTTHTFNIWRTKWLWNNFFRYRAPYERMVLLSRTSAGYDPTFTGDQFGKMKFNGAFTWDMRLGFEVDVWRKNTLYVNLDIYNMLNAQNMTTLQASGIIGDAIAGIASGSTIPVYELGRQFWVEVGYKL